MWLLSIVPGLCIGPLLVVSACITHMLTTYPPHPAWFPPKRGLACSAALHYTPVGPSVCTEAGCRLTLFTSGPACMLPLDYVDNLYIHMASHLTT